ncbi:MAG: diguanylate cyclase [Sediminimonas qiaohouensis]|uniref:diguanylate cyclase n=1 Tax=Sediminimonas qiaohouensis TaxID=552061 RepID=A0A7C9L9L3_9RHOB|nr:diguanylate cyclase [Sediminimonas qiaohouensis]MTJ05954.1 diguanylate cyclase [Sediminimonas qiaohouensis]
MPGNVLIVDDIATNRIILRVKLAAAFYQVTQVQSGQQALTYLKTHQPDLVFVASHLPDMTGLELCSKITARTLGRRLPILMTARRMDAALRIAALQAGAVDVLALPIDDVMLQARLRGLMRSRDTTEEQYLRDETTRALCFADAARPYALAARIAFISSSFSKAEAVRSGLPKRWRAKACCHTGASFWSSVDDGPAPDVCVVTIDARAPTKGLRLLAGLRSLPGTRHAAILAVVEGSNPQCGADALDLGANDLISEDADRQEMNLRLDRLIAQKNMADRVRQSVECGLRAALTDPLTGLYNRRYAMPHLGRMADIAVSNGRGFAVMVADLDHFKTINDRHGHAAGDAVLMEVAQRLRDNVRPDDLVARIGGEEFLIAMPDTDKQQAQATASRLCRVVGTRPFAAPGTGAALPVTMSVGVAVGPRTAPGTPVEALLEQADRALYGAKACGRNQVTLSQTAA